MSTRAAVSLVKKQSASVLQLRCHVRPGASKSREGVVAVTDEAIEICVAAQPQDGKANRAVLEVLGEALRVAKSDLQIVHGTKTRDKIIGLACDRFQHRGPSDEADIAYLVRERLLSSRSAQT
ncbi:hypothetical protein GGR56DRAFT_645988 [Xylariaceae sp. FL0804]|nr:hypothetical protein GGR56DRAFT_645988 [Xylariaceae sp. FL0804]